MNITTNMYTRTCDDVGSYTITIIKVIDNNNRVTDITKYENNYPGERPNQMHLALLIQTEDPTPQDEPYTHLPRLLTTRAVDA